ncbi:unnamed protein product [Spirodela intermedia]|uniref:Uncharacterized protein n=1 Tax=Spirodela intermedia TaxID=51605 RepID=A0A7I8K290_SPIIN|nr:unnamed protein product [Spirodela intermedia]
MKCLERVIMSILQFIPNFMCYLWSGIGHRRTVG